MTYLKSTLLGAAAFAVAVVAFNVTAISLATHFPQLASRIFVAQRHELGWGEYFTIDVPMWQSWFIGTLAFISTFAGSIRRSRQRISVRSACHRRSIIAYPPNVMNIVVTNFGINQTRPNAS